MDIKLPIFVVYGYYAALFNTKHPHEPIRNDDLQVFSFHLGNSPRTFNEFVCTSSEWDEQSEFPIYLLHWTFEAGDVIHTFLPTS